MCILNEYYLFKFEFVYTFGQPPLLPNYNDKPLVIANVKRFSILEIIFFSLVLSDYIDRAKKTNIRFIVLGTP